MHVNNQLYENNESQMFVMAFMGILDVHTGRFVYTNAGHNSPILARKQGSCQYLLSKNGLVLAGRANSKYQDREIELKQGDRIFLYTDGVTEAINRKEVYLVIIDY